MAQGKSVSFTSRLKFQLWLAVVTKELAIVGLGEMSPCSPGTAVQRDSAQQAAM